MSELLLYHGSDHVVEHPEPGVGNPRNDYGQGFYCTAEHDLACEWACKWKHDGVVCSYGLCADGLRVLDLLDDEHTVLHWIAILLQHRTFSIASDIAAEARDYLIERFGCDVSGYDMVHGYRADDSYFSYAEAFVDNGLSLRKLNRALRLGKLGEQYALISQSAMDALKFETSEVAPCTEYYSRFKGRDIAAREAWRRMSRAKSRARDDIYVMDILREGMEVTDARIQRALS